jgi:hypothetical protein
VVARGTVPHQLPGKAILPAQNPDLTDKFGSPRRRRVGNAVWRVTGDDEDP